MRTKLYVAAAKVNTQPLAPAHDVVAGAASRPSSSSRRLPRFVSSFSGLSHSPDVESCAGLPAMSPSHSRTNKLSAGRERCLRRVASQLGPGVRPNGRILRTALIWRQQRLSDTCWRHRSGQLHAASCDNQRHMPSTTQTPFPRGHLSRLEAYSSSSSAAIFASFSRNHFDL